MLGYERETFRRETVISATAPARDRRERPDVQRHDRAARRVDDRSRRRHDGGRRRWGAAEQHGAPGEPSAAEHGRRTSSAGSTTRRVLECDWEPLKATYRRSLVDLAALRFSPPIAGGQQPAGRRPAVVHDDVRPRQHLHQPAGAAVRARAGRDDAARARASGRARASTTSATRTRAGSCTRCATAR